MAKLASIKKFFNIKIDSNFGEQIFNILSEIIDFQYGILSIDDKENICWGKNASGLNSISENLKIKNTKFGTITLYANKFSKNDRVIFMTCACIISNIIKDFEISKIIKMQVDALQDGYLKIKKAEDVKTKFISHISHELRTPLNSIIGFSDILSNEFIGKLNNKQKEYINDIKVSSLNLLEMINEILDMSKIEANAMTLTIKEFHTTDLSNEILNIIKPLIINKEMNYTEHIENFTMSTDYTKLQQIILNLLSNAIKYTPQNGSISFTINKKNNAAEFIVKDTGIGIPKEFQSKIFGKFEQLNSNMQNSTGLGLTITKELVKMLDGKIILESELGQGSKFIVTIPLL